MLRIVDMRRTGVYVVLNKGSLASVGGRWYWSDLDEVRDAVRRHGSAASDHVIRTAP